MIYPTPKFKISSSYFIVENSYTDPVFNDPQVIEQISPMTGHRNFILTGDRSHFIVFVHAEKYADPNATLTTLYGYVGMEVSEFYPDKDGDPIRAADGGLASYVISWVKPVYIDNLMTWTYLIIRFDSTRYVLAPKETHTYWVDENENFIVDENGNKIIF